MHRLTRTLEQLVFILHSQRTRAQSNSVCVCVRKELTRGQNDLVGLGWARTAGKKHCELAQPEGVEAAGQQIGASPS